VPSQRETAKRERADARERRRNQPVEEPNESAEESPSEDGSSTELPVDTLKQAAKVAAASAALGAVAAAARALSERRGSENTEDSQDSERDEPQPAVAAETERGPEEEESRPERESEPEERQPDQQENRQQEPREEPPRRDEPVAGATPEEAGDATEHAKQQLATLVGKEPETVSSLERAGDGWFVTVEVVEVSRIPESTDVLASYQVELDDDLNLRRYARVRRYYRSQADREEM
jgi:hypothetical protein